MSSAPNLGVSPQEITWLRRDIASLQETLDSLVAEWQAARGTSQADVIERSMSAVESDLATAQVLLAEATGEW